MGKVEDKVLKLSLYGTVASVLFGLAFGWLTRSQIIIFDAVYSLVGLGISFISFLVYKIIDNDEKKFKFNKYSLEPLVIIFSSIILLYMCIVSIKGSILDIIAGGSEVEAGLAVVFSVVNLIFTAIIYYKIVKQGNKAKSQLIKSESIQWLMGVVTGVLFLIGFILSLILVKTEYSNYTRYIDSVMVIIASVSFIKAPIDMIISSLKEVLGYKVPKEINELVVSRVEEITDVFEFENSATRVYKVGRGIRVSINFLVKDSVSKEDRKRIKKMISSILDNKKLNKYVEIKYSI